jgi:hypothetical protein
MIEIPWNVSWALQHEFCGWNMCSSAMLYMKPTVNWIMMWMSTLLNCLVQYSSFANQFAGKVQIETMFLFKKWHTAMWQQSVSKGHFTQGGQAGAVADGAWSGWMQLNHQTREWLPLSTSLWELWCTYVALPLEEKTSCRFFHWKSPAFGEGECRFEWQGREVVVYLPFLPIVCSHITSTPLLSCRLNGARQGPPLELPLHLLASQHVKRP